MNIIVTSAEAITDDPDDLAPTRRYTPGPDGGYVPGRLAGYTYDGAHYCPDCADDQTVPFSGDVSEEFAAECDRDDDGNVLVPMAEYPVGWTDPNGFGVGTVSGTDEIDYPGGTCTVCGRRLQTNVLAYQDGPGAEVYEREAA